MLPLDPCLQDGRFHYVQLTWHLLEDRPKIRCQRCVCCHHQAQSILSLLCEHVSWIDSPLVEYAAETHAYLSPNFFIQNRMVLAYFALIIWYGRIFTISKTTSISSWQGAQAIATSQCQALKVNDGCHNGSLKSARSDTLSFRNYEHYLLTAYAKNSVTIVVEPRKVITFFEACACIPMLEELEPHGPGFMVQWYGICDVLKLLDAFGDWNAGKLSYTYKHPI